jgi:hypothetical protein
VAAVRDERLRWLPERLRIGKTAGEDAPVDTLVLMRFAELHARCEVDVVDHPSHPRGRKCVASSRPNRRLQAAHTPNVAAIDALEDLAFGEQTA